MSYPGITFDIPSAGPGGREDPVAFVSVHSKDGEGKPAERAIIQVSQDNCLKQAQSGRAEWAAWKGGDALHWR